MIGTDQGELLSLLDVMGKNIVEHTKQMAIVTSLIGSLQARVERLEDNNGDLS